MRLIDADALKYKNVAEVNGILTHILTAEEIDNAPTVEPEVKKVLIANVTFDTEKLKELTDEIVDRIKNGEIVLQDERQKGEWINDFDSLKCPFAEWQLMTKSIGFIRKSLILIFARTAEHKWI